MGSIAFRRVLTAVLTIAAVVTQMPAIFMPTVVSRYAAAAQFSPSTVDFGSVFVGATAARTLTVTNDRPVTLRVSSSTTAAPFSVTGGTCGATMNAGGSCTIELAYSPTSAGASTGQVSVLYFEGGDVGTYRSIPLSGTATDAPDLVVTAVTPPSSITPGGTMSYSWVVRNQGTADAVATASSWADQAWISPSATSIDGAYPAGGIVAPYSLSPDSAYQRSFSATVGAIPPGSYYFIIQTDSSAQLGEANESNNLSAGVPITVAPPAPRLAYVYATDTTARDAWVSFLTAEGFVVDAMTIAVSATADLSGYRAVLISDDSGSLSTWGTPAAVANIAGSGKRTVGLGQGGYAYFGRKYGGASGTIGWGNGAHGSASSVVVVDRTDSAWTSPNSVDAGTGETVALYGSAVADVGIFDERADKGHRYIGRHATDARYYNVIGQSASSCDVLWGFSGSASTLTLRGKQLFENLLSPCGVQKVTLTAEVREDLNRNGVMERAEPLLTAPRLEVFRINADGSRTSLGSAVNSPNLTMSGIDGGTFDVVETDPAGFVSTSPNTVRITVNTGSSLTRFMDARGGVSGIARHRETPDGSLVREVLLAGATVTLLKADGTHVRNADGTNRRTTAGADGSFAFAALAANTRYAVGYDGAFGGRNYLTGVRFTTDATGGAYVPEAHALYNRGNHTWITAFPLPNNIAVLDQVWRRGQATWYRFPISPQQTVTIELTGCDFNCDLVVYRDLQQVHKRLLADAKTQAGIRLSLQGDIMADDLDADDLDADDLDADDLDADDLDADDLDADGDGLTGYGTTYVAAQRKGLRAASLTPGLAPETVVINTRDLTGHLYVRVAGGASLGGVFRVTARATGDASCVAAPLTSRLPSTTFSSAVAGKRSLILTDTQAYGLPAGPARDAFLATLGTFAAHSTVQGLVVDLAGDANIQQLRADWLLGKTCVAQANLVTDATREVVQRFRTAAGGSFEYLINIGGDSVIPFRRVADWAEISRESRYNPPLQGATASEASLISDTFLNDDFYVSQAVDGPNRTLYLPDAAVGRIVESVNDVTAYIAMYLAANGTASPTTALSSGYDFNLDLADYVTSQLELRGVTVDDDLTNDTWTSADWRAKVLERAVQDAFGILSLQGHFSANRLVPADNGQRVLSSELAAVADGRFLKALVYSLGCHSGYSIVDADGTILTQVDAFPEVFVRKGATVVAGTGYQYGETVLMKNTEALIALLTEELGYSGSPSGVAYGPNGVPIGKALMYAKRAYMGSTATPRGIDLKVVGVSTVYGSPTMSFKLPSPQARPAAGTLSPAQVAGFSGLTALNVAASDAVTPVTGGGGTYYTAGGATTTAPYRPIAPLETIDANVAGSVLQGSVFLGGAYNEINFTPRLSIPATELGGEAPRYANDVFMPVLPVRSNLFNGDALQVVPFQYRSNADGTSGVARVFGSGVNVRAFWSSITGTSAAADAPAIRDVAVAIEPAKLVVVATLRGVTSPGIAEVWLTYTDITATNKSFASIPMTPMAAAVPDAAGAGFTRHYSAELTGTPSTYRFLVQAVSGNGRVSAATNNGQLFGVPLAPPVQVDRVGTTLELTAAASAAYRSTISATATLRNAGGQLLSGKPVTFTLGGSSRTVNTVNGVATATLDVNVTPRAAPYALTAGFAGDDTSLSSSASRSVTVGRAATALQLIQLIAGSPQYSDGASVAKLTANGLTLNEQPIVITRGTASVATFTDFGGNVRFDTMDFGAGVGDSVLTIAYPGNDRYAGTSLDVTVPVQAENATLTLVQPGPQPIGSSTFQATVAQAPDGSLGDLRRAVVTFTFTPVTGTSVIASAPASAAGAATVTVTLPAGLFQVTAVVSGDFTSDVVAMVVPVYDASAFVSGGGHLTTKADPGGMSIGVLVGAKANFGFVAKYGVDGTTATGNVNVHVKSAKGKDNDTDAQAKVNGSLKFKATSFSWLVIAGSGAAFAGAGTVNGDAGYQFRIDVVDDGSSDVFVMHIWDAGSSYSVPDYIIRGTLGGGSIRIHR